MDIFQFFSIVSLGLSLYLSLNKIYNDQIRISVEVISVYKGSNIMYINFVVTNSSANPLAISDAFITQKENNAVAKSAHYEKLIAYNNRKVNGELLYRNEVPSDKLPINIPSKTAQSIILALPTEENELTKFTNSNAVLELKIKDKFYSTEFDFISKNFLKEQVLKAVKR